MRPPLLTILALLARQLSPHAALRLGAPALALVSAAGVFRPVLLEYLSALRAWAQSAPPDERAWAAPLLLAAWALVWAGPLRGLARLELWRPWIGPNYI